MRFQDQAFLSSLCLLRLLEELHQLMQLLAVGHEHLQEHVGLLPLRRTVLTDRNKRSGSQIICPA